MNGGAGSDEWVTADDLEAKIDEQFSVAAERPLSEKIRREPAELLVYVLGIVFFAYHLWYAYSLPIVRARHGIVHLALVLMVWGTLGLLGADRTTVRGKVATVGYALYTVATAVPFYLLYASYQRLLISAGLYSDTDLLVGATIICLLLVALATLSRLILAVVVLGLVYSYFGPYMPGILAHGGLSLERIVTMNTVEMQGVFGTLLQVVATWVVMFVMLAALIERYGGMATFIKGVTRVTARYPRLRIGQVAVFSSMMFGSINGATTANVVTTGSFTIPLMKENGYPPRVAAALEAVASCGGQVLPPVMGTSAFIMAELIEPSYTEIIVAALLPAVLFYATIFVSIELYVRRFGERTRRAAVESAGPSVGGYLVSWLRHYEYLGTFVVLMYWLVYVQSDPMLAGLYSIATLVVLRFVKVLVGVAIARRDGETAAADLTTAIRTFARETLEGTRRSAEAVVGITIIVAALGIVVRAFIVTGFAQNLSAQLMALAGGSVVLMVVLAALASIVFGMGMPTVAAYLLVALFVAPPLIDVTGIGALPVHLFVFYFAIVSNITPPIAVAVVIAQGLAGSKFLETTVDALRMGFPMFLLPFVFIFNSSLLGITLESVVLAAVIAVGFTSLAIAAVGYDDSPPVVRAGFLLAGAGAVFIPSFAVQIPLVTVVIGALLYLNPTVIRSVRNVGGR
ncbi:TRAP transporter permease [Halomarina halobia]|uniref:TRAP transporter permease n=1 Tax=Halomarina halobia TaxID=3033386 RepID=A0ABD6ADL1_9EURY|nr:TRAP transporter fused permease subunit [Halomarina sp. PSR21]